MTEKSLRRRNARFEIKQLRCAVVAADCGSFRRAAELLNIDQSSLSRLICDLERELSTTIFHRSPAGAVVLPAGRPIIRHAKFILKQINDLGGTAHGQLCEKLLSVGFCTSLSTGGLRNNLQDFRRQFPQFRLATIERSRYGLATRLQNGTLDIVISTGSLPLAGRWMVHRLHSEKVLIALPEDHRLVKKDVIHWTDLRDETMLISQYDPYWEFEELIVSKLVSRDDRPRIERHDVSRTILKSLVGMKLGLGLMLESDSGVAAPSIVFKELRDGSGPARFEFSAFWLESNDNPALGHFLNLLKERYPSLS
jgi:DNA-binding transcriptional LysR family regulator